MFALCKLMCYFCKDMAGIYIHIPFCSKRCYYCDFYSTTDNKLAEKYIDTLLIELKARIEEIGEGDITTIYIGGGTPSQLPISLLAHLVNEMKVVIDFNKVGEFTIEVNPDDVTDEYMRSCRGLGINRVSMGIQSFVDAELQVINRRHTSTQAKEAVALMRNAGFDNISIDLIYGLPLQTHESWHFSVEEAIKLGVPHISCYNLSYEYGTVLYNKREKGEVKECGEDDCVKMYEDMVTMLKNAGYVHYEISNFARPDCFSRHNSNYWNQTPYLGLGASAHSFDGNMRRFNPASISDYISKVETSGRAYEEETENEWERYNEYVMINMRTMWGVNKDRICALFGDKLYVHFIKESSRFINSGELKDDNGTLVVTEKGVMLSDYIIMNLMYIP